MSHNKNNKDEENSYIFLEESFYCSTPKIGVISKSNDKIENSKYMNIMQNMNKDSNNFTFRLNSKEASTDYISTEKKKNRNKNTGNIRRFNYSSYKNKNNCTNSNCNSNNFNKNSNVQKYISQPIISINNNFEEQNFISHCIKEELGSILSYNNSIINTKYFPFIKEIDREDYIIPILREKEKEESNNHKKLKKELKKKTSFKKYKTNKNLDNQLSNIKKYMSDIKLCKNKRKEYKLRSSIALERKKSENYKKSYENNININKKNKKLYRIKSIDENLFKKVFSVDKLNKNKIKKDNNNIKKNNIYLKKHSSNIEFKNSSSLTIKFENFLKDSNSTDKLILNYKNKKEILEILSDKENIENYYEYLSICLKTLKEMSKSEVPKSKYKLKFKFPEEILHKKIALFDLDETLVHCVGEITEKNKDKKEFINTNKIKVLLPNKKEIIIGINIRPHWKESLDKIKNIYNIIIFTASHCSYSDAVLNFLDPDNIYFKYRLYRDSCVQYKNEEGNFYIKDLDIFQDNFNLKDIIIIDNSILSFAYHLNNGIPVVPFYDSQIDTELPLLSYYLLSIANYYDLREANKEFIKLEFFLKQIKNDDIESIMTNKNEIIKNIDFIECSRDKDKQEKKVSDNINKCNNLSEKKIFHISNFSRVYPEIKKFNSIKVEHKNDIDFFEKWKNAYLKLASKK